MGAAFDLLIRGGTLVTPLGVGTGDIGVRGGCIAALGCLRGASARETLEARGLHILPGAMDAQVHFREPGEGAAEDLESGTAAAALGGITAICEMPNTTPPTTSREALHDKLVRARDRAWVDHAFFVGATAGNIEELAELERMWGCAGVKLFMGSSTGNLLLAGDHELLQVLSHGQRRVAVHAEDEERLQARRAACVLDGDPASHPIWRDAETAFKATRRLLAMARRAGRLVHVLHVSTREEVRFLAGHKELASFECTPQHLTLEAPSCYRELGTLAQMNPPIRGPKHRAALWEALSDGSLDMLASDHAPHTKEAKARPYPASPSGMPGVQTLLPLMLNHLNAGRLTLERLVDLTSGSVARVYGLLRKGRLAVGFDADLSIVDLKARRRITSAWIKSRCGWSPFVGLEVTGWPVCTVIRGRVVMREGELLGPPAGRPLLFQGTLQPRPDEPGSPSPSM